MGIESEFSPGGQEEGRGTRAKLPKSKKPTPKLNKDPRVNTESTLQSKLVLT